MPEPELQSHKPHPLQKLKAQSLMVEFLRMHQTTKGELALHIQISVNISGGIDQ